MRALRGWRGACLLLFSVLACVGAWHHEPWADEAHGWLLARELALPDLYWTYLRYEGSPGLWHTLLLVPAKLGLPYEWSVKLVSLACAIAGVAAFLAWSPLPIWASVLVPFTYFVAYQYAIVARSYCLLLLMMSFAAHGLRWWTRRPLAYAAVLIALSHVSVHGTIIALGFGAQGLFDAYRQRRQHTRQTLQRMALGVLLFCVNLALLYALLRPPADLAFSPGWHLDAMRITIRMVFYGATALAGHFAPQMILVAACVALGGFVIWAALRGVVFAPVTIIGLLLLAAVKYANAWHEGIVFLSCVMVLWLAAERGGTPGTGLRLPRVLLACATAVLMLHVAYAARTWLDDLEGTYSPTRDVARYLRDHRAADNVMWNYGFVSIGVQPYFRDPIFANRPLPDPGAIWLWSDRNPALQVDEARLCSARPALVLIGWTTEEARPPNVRAVTNCGYKLEKEFAGAGFFQGAVFERIIIRLYRYPLNSEGGD